MEKNIVRLLNYFFNIQYEELYRIYPLLENLNADNNREDKYLVTQYLITCYIIGKYRKLDIDTALYKSEKFLIKLFPFTKKQQNIVTIMHPEYQIGKDCLSNYDIVLSVYLIIKYLLSLGYKFAQNSLLRKGYEDLQNIIENIDCNINVKKN